jgi:hypothetical protein
MLKEQLLKQNKKPIETKDQNPKSVKWRVIKFQKSFWFEIGEIKNKIYLYII